MLLSWVVLQGEMLRLQWVCQKLLSVEELFGSKNQQSAWKESFLWEKVLLVSWSHYKLQRTIRIKGLIVAWVSNYLSLISVASASTTSPESSKLLLSAC